jgi:UDP:flavonoid glycosyltransferase YjiC (YdhE family)
MRILFSFAGGNGHVVPLLPIALAAKDAGHDLAFASQAAMLPQVEAAGFTAFATGGATVGAIPERLPLLRLDLEREAYALREGYARQIARERAGAVRALCEAWQPDLLVCDELDFGSMVAAEHLGLPYATVLVIASGAFVRHELIAEPLHELRAAYGLPPDPELKMLSRYLLVSPFPPSYRDPAFPLPATAHTIRSLARTRASSELPPWPVHLPDAPTVYFSLGTVFNLESGDLFHRVLAGLRDMPVNVIATVGHEIDPAEFGPQSAHMHIARYIPQSSILPQCDLMISHGGSGSVIGALAHGVPMVLLPLGADQPMNAERCTALGVAQVLDAVDATPQMLRQAVATVLADPGYRQAAERLRDEIAALPGPESAVPLLERLVTQRRTGPA